MSDTTNPLTADGPRSMRHRFGLAAVALVAALVVGVLAPGAASAKKRISVIESPSNARNISALGSTIAYTENDRLYVGTSKGASVVDTGAGTVDGAAVGTERGGRRVVVFSRCGVPGRLSCDLAEYDPKSKAISAVPGVNRASWSEYPGTMVDGTITFFRTVGDKASLWIRPAGATSARELTNGASLATNGQWFVSYREGDMTVGLCGEEILDLVSLGGKRVEVKKQGCGLDEQQFSGAQFVGGHTLVFVVTALSGTTFYRYDLRTRRLETATWNVNLTAFAAIDRDRFIAVVEYEKPRVEGQDQEFANQLVRVAGLDWKRYGSR